MSHMKKILITGGAGFIGYHLAKQLLENPENIVVLVDNLWRGRMDEDLKKLLTNPRSSFHQLDLVNLSTYDKLDKDFDQIYHLAAINGTKWFYKLPYENLRINTLTVLFLLDWITTLEKKPKILFTSTCETYAGALEAFGQLTIPTPEDVPRVISDIHNPRWSYAASKIVGEMSVIHYAQTHNTPAVVVDPHNFYGPREGYDHVIPEMIVRILKRVDPFPIYGADQTRAYCYVDDAVRALQLVMESPVTDAHPVQTFHIGVPVEVTARELAEHLFEIAGWKPNAIDAQPAPQGSVMRRAADTTKIQNQLGWKPKIDLKEGLRRSFEWYSKRPTD
jgi:nucleoside-diphosphate-sugar epimerase